MELLRLVVAIAFIITALSGLLWLLRRRAPFLTLRPKTRRMEPVERLALTAHHSLHLVRLADRALVICVHGGGCALLESRPWNEMEGASQHAAGATAGGRS